MKNKFVNKYTIVSIIFLILLLFVIKDILIYKEISYDSFTFNLFKDLRNNKITLFMTIITNFGSLLFIGVLLIIFFILYKNKKTICYLLNNVIIIFLINDFVKHIFGRARPSDNNLIKESGYSFPSSHAMLSIVFYGLLIYLVYKNINNKIIKYILIVLLTILIVLICISRIYLGVHYLSDIVGGVSLGIIYLMIFLSLYKDFEKKV